MCLWCSLHVGFHPRPRPFLGGIFSDYEFMMSFFFSEGSAPERRQRSRASRNQITAGCTVYATPTGNRQQATGNRQHSEAVKAMPLVSCDPPHTPTTQHTPDDATHTRSMLMPCRCHRAGKSAYCSLTKTRTLHLQKPHTGAHPICCRDSVDHAAHAQRLSFRLHPRNER